MIHFCYPRLHGGKEFPAYYMISEIVAEGDGRTMVPDSWRLDTSRRLGAHTACCCTLHLSRILDEEFNHKPVAVVTIRPPEKEKEDGT